MHCKVIILTVSYNRWFEEPFKINVKITPCVDLGKTGTDMD